MQKQSLFPPTRTLSISINPDELLGQHSSVDGLLRWVFIRKNEKIYSISSDNTNSQYISDLEWHISAQRCKKGKNSYFILAVSQCYQKKLKVNRGGRVYSPPKLEIHSISSHKKN